MYNIISRYCENKATTKVFENGDRIIDMVKYQKDYRKLNLLYIISSVALANLVGIAFSKMNIKK